MRTFILVSCAAVALALAAPAQAQQTSGAPAVRRQPAAPKHKPAAPAAAGAFEQLLKEAAVAREASKFDQAIALYQRAIKLRPDSAEAHWHLGTVYYEMDRCDQARPEFRRVTDLNSKEGGAWTMKGLCEFNLKNYETALSDLGTARRFGFGANPELISVARYHLAVLLNRIEEYEQAAKLLNEFAQEGNDSPRIVEAFGIATLRIPVLPAELPGARREQVMMAGRAAYFAGARLLTAAQKAFQEVVARFPETPHVHYAFGVFLVNEQPDLAIEQFKQELKISPRHPLAKLQIAFEYIRRGEWDAAKLWAQEAVDENPTSFAARKGLGQILLEQGDFEGAVRELEAGVKLAPDSPQLRFTLATAYRRAGRPADAAREHAEFTRLDRMLRTERTGAQSVGGMELDPAPPTPQQPQQP